MRRLVLGTFVFFSAMGWAQESVLPIEEVKKEIPKEEKKEEAVATEEKKVERVQVTGSHIKRIDVEGASPVQTITRKDLEKSGYNSVSDVLRDTSANAFGSAREDSGSNAAGVAHVNLRGLGSSNTLVLLNGQRLPTDAVTGAVDINLIPMAAVERVEVLKDGASAIYGSDALGGVVNVITRKDFQGSEISLSQSTPEQSGGKKQEISLVNGINGERFNTVNVVQYRDNDVIYSRDRFWTSKGLSPTGSPGSYKSATGTWQADPSCPPELIQETPQGKICQFRYPLYSTEIPALQQFSVMTETNAEISSRVRAKVRGGYTERRVQWSFAPAPGTFKIPGAVADTLKDANGNPLPGRNPGEDLTVRYRLLDLGTRDTENDTKGYNVLAGITTDVGKGWEVETTLSHNMVRTTDIGVNGYALTPALQKAIAEGKINPFAAPGQRGNFEGLRYQPWERMTSELSSADIKASGEMGHLPAGRFGLAVGTSFAFQKYEDKFDEKSVNEEVFGGAGSSGGGQRDTRAVYTELVAPVTKKLEASLAVRYDQYSDFGDTTNPKLGLSYRVTPSLLVRSSVGTGFKAPLMQDLYAAKSIGYPSAIDPIACDIEKAAGGATPSCKPQQYEVTSEGNKGLKEERSLSYNVGAVYQPSRSFNISTDLFLTKLKNKVGIDYDDLLEAEKKFGKAFVEQNGVVIKRDPGSNYIESIEAPLQNLSAQEVTGIDVGTEAYVSKFKLGITHSQLFYFKEEGFPGTGLKNKLGQNGRPPWRNTASLTFLPTERNDITFSAMTVAKHEKAVAEMGQLQQYTSYDLMYSYKSKSFGTLSAGVKNLFASTPPLDESNPNNMLDTTIYDQIGRQVFTGYKASF